MDPHTQWIIFFRAIWRFVTIGASEGGKLNPTEVKKDYSNFWEGKNDGRLYLLQASLAVIRLGLGFLNVPQTKVFGIGYGQSNANIIII